ncbi:MAG: transposase [Planctomycetes bacterium]|nr:transposase [Planctomycetota bacterium]
MFNYNSAARQLYNKDVVSLAILCDDRLGWKPTTFGYGRWGCRMELTFRIAKLLEYAEDVDALEASPNPMATLVLAHCKTIETRRDPTSRHAWKLRVVKALLQRRWSTEDVRQLFGVIDWMMMLPDELETAFQSEVDHYEQENKMEYLTGHERRGFAKGLEKGREEGMDEGLRIGMLEAIIGTLKARFGPAGRRLIPKVRAMDDLSALREFKKFLDTMPSLQDVRAYLG